MEVPAGVAHRPLFFVTILAVVMEDGGKREMLNERCSPVSNYTGKKCSSMLQDIIVVSVVFSPVLGNRSCHFSNSVSITNHLGEGVNSNLIEHQQCL